MGNVVNRRIKILARKNLKMTEGKLAAQSVHAALGLVTVEKLDPLMSVVVLLVSDKKFEEAISSSTGLSWLVRDAGYTEIPAGTATCFAFLEDDPRSGDS